MNREQQLIDIMFEASLTICNHEYFKEATDEEVVVWIRDQLYKCGFDVVPKGASHGVLV